MSISPVTEKATEKSLPAAKPSSPQIRLWAVLGVVSLVVIFTGWTRWVLSPGFGHTPTGPDPLPGWRLVMLRSIEVFSTSSGCYVAWRFVLRPLVRQRTLTF